MCATSDEAKMKLLLAAGADAEAIDEWGQTALGYARGLLTESASEDFTKKVRECIHLLAAYSR